MTIQELHTFALDLDIKIDALISGANSAKEILRIVKEATNPQIPMSAALNALPGSADQIAVSFFPDWQAALQSVEVAADALGTDGLSVIPPANPN